MATKAALKVVEARRAIVVRLLVMHIKHADLSAEVDLLKDQLRDEVEKLGNGLTEQTLICLLSAGTEGQVQGNRSEAQRGDSDLQRTRTVCCCPAARAAAGARSSKAGSRRTCRFQSAPPQRRTRRRKGSRFGATEFIRNPTLTY
jgi:hypothetical protein